MLLLLLNGHKAIVSTCSPIYLVFQSSEKLDGLLQLVNEEVDLSAKQHKWVLENRIRPGLKCPPFILSINLLFCVVDI